MGKKRAKRKARRRPALRLQVKTMADLDEAVRRGEISGQPLPPEMLGKVERQLRNVVYGVDWARPGAEREAPETHAGEMKRRLSDDAELGDGGDADLTDGTDGTDRTDPGDLYDLVHDDLVDQRRFVERLVQALSTDDVADAVAEALIRRKCRITKDRAAWAAWAAEGVAENLAESMRADQ